MAKRDEQRRDDEHERTWTAIPRVLASSSEKHAYLLVLAGPQFGAIFPLVPATGRRETARGRLEDDAVKAA